ncbi:MAG: hypothetical protein M0Q38_08545 [Bacteroidales bacterium]|jgi:hypothetical protein|nr:hypothetical protein [Bacteroidales bacterium]
MMLDAGCFAPDACVILDAGYRIQDTRCKMQDTGCWMLDTKYKMQDARYMMLAAGCWIQYTLHFL